MGCIKRGMAAFLCMLVAFTAAFCIVPCEHVQAAGKVGLYWRNDLYNLADGKTLMVKKGVKDFYIGDYMGAHTEPTANGYKDYGYLSMNSGVKYSSSKKSVAAVDKKGKITAKKEGTTTITIKFKGKSAKVTVNVVKAFDTNYSVDAKEKAAAQKFVKAYGNGITAKNRYAVLNAYNVCREYNIYGGRGYVYDWSNDIYVLHTPQFQCAALRMDKVSDYIAARNPFAVQSGKALNITALSGAGQKIQATLKSKVTENQIFAAKALIQWSTDVKVSKRAVFPVYVYDTENGHCYYAEATIKKGSKTLSIQTKSLKLKRGRKYKIVAFSGCNSSWLDNSKVTAFKAD